MTPNQQLRQQLRQHRVSLSKKQVSKAAQAVASRLISHPWLLGAKVIAGYRATQGELDPSHLLKEFEISGKTICLPVLHPYKHNQLVFVRWSEGEQLKKNRYGIEEPVITRMNLIPRNQIDLVLVPLVAFDNNCNRLGMGAGYYDRSFSDRRMMRHWRRPKLVGLAYAFQYTNKLKINFWDVPLDIVVTEDTFYNRTYAINSFHQ